MSEVQIAPGGSASVFVLHEGMPAGTATTSRAKLLAFATVIISGHGPAFRPTAATSR